MNQKTKDLILAAGALALVVGIVFGGIFVYRKMNDNSATEKVPISKVEGFGETPQEAVAKYIYSAGNIGNPDDVNSGKLLNDTARQNNKQRREDAYDKAIEGVITEGPANGIKKSELSNYTNSLQWPEYYVVPEDSIKVSKDNGEWTEQGLDGKDYSGVKVKATFESNKIYYMLKATDASSDGTYLKMGSKKLFENIEFKVAKIGDNAWKVFSIEDNGEIGPRFAIWSPEFSKKLAVNEESVVLGEIKPDKGAKTDDSK